MIVRLCAIGGTIFALYVENGCDERGEKSVKEVELEEIVARCVPVPADLLERNDVCLQLFGTTATARIGFCIIGQR